MGFIMFKRLTVFLNICPIPAYVPMQNAIFLCVSSGMGSTTGGTGGLGSGKWRFSLGFLGRQAWPRLLVKDFVRVVKVYSICGWTRKSHIVFFYPSLSSRLHPGRLIAPSYSK